MGSLTHQTINYVKGAGAGVEKRILDQIKALKHYVHCCVDTGEMAEFTLTANVLGTGNWQNIPAAGLPAIAAPGAGKVNVITKVVINVNVTADITGGGAATVGNFGIYQVAGGNPLVGTNATAAGAITDEVQTPLIIGGAIDDYTLNSAIVIDHTAAGSDAGAVAVGTAKIKIFYKTVSFI
tara:strand:+ start:412 stop:954 length:543 start_codon:yes stop_codon:yes gene_type:complete